MTSVRYWQTFLGQTEPPQNLWQWVSWGVVIIVSTLAGVVGTLFKLNEQRNAAAIAELKARVQQLELELKEALERERKLLMEQNKDSCDRAS